MEMYVILHYKKRMTYIVIVVDVVVLVSDNSNFFHDELLRDLYHNDAYKESSPGSHSIGGSNVIDAVMLTSLFPMHVYVTCAVTSHSPNHNIQ